MRHRSSHSWLESYQAATEAGAFMDAAGRAISRLVDLGVADEQVMSLARARIERHERRVIRGEVGPFPVPRLESGDLMLGDDEQGNRVLIDSNALTAHSLLIGGSGSGKSTLLSFIMIQLMGTIKATWSIDLRKRDLRRLRPLVKRKGVDLIVLPITRGRFNPLQLESGNPRQAIPRRVRSLATSLDLSPPAYRLFGDACWAEYERFGQIDGSGRVWPTLFDVYERVKRDDTAHPQVRAGLLDRLRGVLVGLGPEVLAWRQAWSAEHLASKDIVFEGGGVTESMAMLIVEPLVESRLSSALESGTSNRPLELLIAFEDAQSLLSSSQGGELRVLDEFAGLVRGAGIGLLFGAQSAHGVSQHLLANTATKLLGRVGNARDVATIGGAMGLTGEQVRWAMHSLVPGRFVCQAGDAAWRKPFALQVPRMRIESSLDDREIAASQRPLLRLPVEPAKEYLNWSPIERVEVRSKPSQRRRQGTNSVSGSSPTEITTISADTPTTPTASLSAEALRLLRSLRDAPGTPMSKLHTAASISRRALYRLRDELLGQGLITQTELSTSARGRPAVVLVLTALGRRVLGAQ
ncbi:MAG: hypothetical protein KDA31_07285 [Phycisphaerales bacterium]|nr:hypothetical protein [Phycisphaerales bacterium]